MIYLINRSNSYIAFKCSIIKSERSTYNDIKPMTTGPLPLRVPAAALATLVNLNWIAKLVRDATIVPVARPNILMIARSGSIVGLFGRCTANSSQSLFTWCAADRAQCLFARCAAKSTLGQGWYSHLDSILVWQLQLLVKLLVLVLVKGLYVLAASESATELPLWVDEAEGSLGTVHILSLLVKEGGFAVAV